MKPQGFFRPVPGYRKWTGGGDKPTVMVSLDLFEVDLIAGVLERDDTIEGAGLTEEFQRLRKDFLDWKGRAS